MGSKSDYKRIPSSEAEAALKFGSPFNFNAPSFLYSGPNDSQYSSVFTYSNENEQNEQYKTLDGPVASRAPRSCVIDCCAHAVVGLMYFAVAITLPITGWFSFKRVQSYERLIIYRLGRLLDAKGPGTVFTLPCIDRITRVDLRMRAFSVPPQKVLTRDNAGVEVGADLYYRIKDPVLSVNAVQNLDNSTRVIGQTSLQKQVLRSELAVLESNKFHVCQGIQDEMNKMTLTWGVEVSKVELSVIKILNPPETQKQENPLQNIIGPMLFPNGGGVASGMGELATHLVQLLQPAGAHQQPQQQAQVRAINENEPSTSEGLGTPKVAAAAVGASTTSLQFDSPQSLVQTIQPHLSEQLVSEFGKVYKFVITGERPGAFFLDLKHGCGSVGEGIAPGSVDVTLTMTDDTMSRLLLNEVGAFNAYMGGQIEIEGDLRAALKLGDLIEVLRQARTPTLQSGDPVV